MKRYGIFIFILAALISLSLVAMAADTSTKPASVQDYRKQIGNKAERGVKNVLFGWTEIPKKVVDITKETKNPIWGAVAGVFQGTCNAFARTASGVVDVATCGIKNDPGPLMQTEMNTVPSTK